MDHFVDQFVGRREDGILHLVWQKWEDYQTSSSYDLAAVMDMLSRIPHQFGGNRCIRQGAEESEEGEWQSEWETTGSDADGEEEENEEASGLQSRAASVMSGPVGE